MKPTILSASDAFLYADYIAALKPTLEELQERNEPMRRYSVTATTKGVEICFLTRLGHDAIAIPVTTLRYDVASSAIEVLILWLSHKDRWGKHGEELHILWLALNTLAVKLDRGIKLASLPLDYATLSTYSTSAVSHFNGELFYTELYETNQPKPVRALKPAMKP